MAVGTAEVAYLAMLREGKLPASLGVRVITDMLRFGERRGETKSIQRRLSSQTLCKGVSLCHDMIASFAETDRHVTEILACIAIHKPIIATESIGVFFLQPHNSSAFPGWLPVILFHVDACQKRKSRGQVPDAATPRRSPSGVD